MDYEKIQNQLSRSIRVERGSDWQGLTAAACSIVLQSRLDRAQQNRSGSTWKGENFARHFLGLASTTRALAWISANDGQTPCLINDSPKPRPSRI